DFRLALMHNRQTGSREDVIDFTRYDIPAKEPQEMTRQCRRVCSFCFEYGTGISEVYLKYGMSIE
ncbi:MAG: hypothetical protein LBK22_05700, partial [Tannerella sp.]|nr:hypothetical protein [Tannerella sp.]